MTQPTPFTSRDSVYLADILKSAQIALNYVQHVEFDAFQQDVRTQDAVLYRFTVMGEAARRISEAYKLEHPQLPWREMLGMRNIVVHKYTRVRIIRVWEAVVRDLPALITQIESIAESRYSEP